MNDADRQCLWDMNLLTSWCHPISVNQMVRQYLDLLKVKQPGDQVDALKCLHQTGVLARVPTQAFELRLTPPQFIQGHCPAMLHALRETDESLPALLLRIDDLTWKRSMARPKHLRSGPQGGEGTGRTRKGTRRG